jgi:hypothetical protein
MLDTRKYETRKYDRDLELSPEGIVWELLDENFDDKYIIYSNSTKITNIYKKVYETTARGNFRPDDSGGLAKF